MRTLLAYLAFMIGVASPGPSVLAVMGMAMAQGRVRALVLASGVVSGSLFWGMCAALGLAALMRRYAAALVLVKLIGGLYLLWMAWQAARKAIRGTRAHAGADDALAFVASCVPLSAAVFTCYALAFSTTPARRAYRAGERGINAVLAGVFGYAGLRMLLSNSITAR